MDRYYSLQALRGLAAISVAAYHCLRGLSGDPQSFPLGADGVDLFFVLSGIVMVISTLQGTTPMQFMYRRFIRVVPLYWLATGAALAYFYARYDRFPTVDHWLTSLLFLPPPSPHPLPILYPGWTLNFEMAFYSIIAVSLLAGRRAFVVAALVTMSAAALAVKTGYNAVDWYLNPRLAEFSAGLLIGIMLRRGMHIDRSYGSLLLLSGSTVLLLNSRSVPAIPILHWGLPTVAVLLGALAFEQSRIVRSRIAQVLGDASYSIYLAHPFVIWFAEWGLGPTRHPVYGWLALAASIALGLIVHRSIEKPALKLLKRYGHAPRSGVQVKY